MKTLALVAIVRDEGPYIAEWLEFHRLVGFERFLIYDDRSTDDTIGILMRRDRGDVVIHPYSEGWHAERYVCPVLCTFNDTPQICAYNHAVQHHAGEATWAAFIDVDEYLFHATEDDLRVALAPYAEQVGVFVPWLIFGRNGHKTKPAGLTIESYTRRGFPGMPPGYGNQGKQIARMDRMMYWGECGAHNLRYRGGFPVDSYGTTVPGFHAPIPRLNSFRLNHYYNRSEAEAIAKTVRQDRNAKPGFQPDWRRMQVHDRNEVLDTDILRFLPRLQQALKESA